MQHGSESMVFERTKIRREPALWERGGSLNTGFGEVVLIADEQFQPMRALAYKAGERQALFPLRVGMTILICTRQRSSSEDSGVDHFTISIFRVKLLLNYINVAELKQLHRFSGDRWDIEPPFEALAMVNAAKAKTRQPNCTRPFFEKVNERTIRVRRFGEVTVVCQDCQQAIAAHSPMPEDNEFRVVCSNCGSAFLIMKCG